MKPILLVAPRFTIEDTAEVPRAGPGPTKAVGILVVTGQDGHEEGQCVDHQEPVSKVLAGGGATLAAPQP